MSGGVAGGVIRRAASRLGEVRVGERRADRTPDQVTAPITPGRTPFGRVRAPNPYLPEAGRPRGSSRAPRPRQQSGRPRLDARADGLLAVIQRRRATTTRAARRATARPQPSTAPTAQRL